MTRIAFAAFVYFAAVFAAAMALGTIRVLVLEPRIGVVAATLCEAPFLITAMFFSARWAPGFAKAPVTRAALLAIGALALVFQEIAEHALWILGRGQSFESLLAHYTTSQGMIYLLLLVIFLFMPLIVHGRQQEAK